MKVEPSAIKGAAGPYKAGGMRGALPSVAGDGAPAVPPVDSLTVSVKAHEAARLRSLLRAEPEVRTALVERIRARVEAGQYHVAPLDVAERLLRSRVLD